MKRINKTVILFTMGGLIYVLIEFIWRVMMDKPQTHWSMFIVGGIAFLAIGSINECFDWKTPIWLQTIIGTICVLIIEFVSGCIINLWLGLHVWDYSNMPFNLCGQICPQFTVAWAVLVTIAIVVDDYLRYILSWFKQKSKMLLHFVRFFD